ncbi:MAG: hypothetical protein ACM336_09960 [Acidobacteriota bacterium]
MREAAAALWFTIIYLPATLLIAWRRPLWNDEMFTWYIAGRPRIGDIWTALLTGAEQIPPAFYWITRPFVGHAEWAMRLPEILGFWLMGVCVIAIVARRAPAAYGLVAALAALFTGAYPYAYEGRPYGIVLGLAALALLAWQRGWTAALALALAAAVSVHYYAVLLFAPLAAGEAVRTWRAGRLQWRVWAALAAGAAPLVAWLPLIRGARSYSGTFWARPGYGSLAEFLPFLFDFRALPLAVVLIAAGAWLLARPKSVAPGEATPLEETAAAVGFMALPVLAVAIGKAATGAYAHRYALAAAAGFCVFAAWALAAIFGGRTRPALAIAAPLSVLFFARAAWDYREASRQAARHAHMIEYLESRAEAALPIVIADPHVFFELSHYAPRPLARRLRYYADAKLARRYVGTDTVDRGLLAMRQWAPLDVEPFPPREREFLIYGHPSVYAWLVPELARRGFPMEITGSIEERLLVRAGAPGAR